MLHIPKGIAAGEAAPVSDGLTQFDAVTTLL